MVYADYADARYNLGLMHLILGEAPAALEQCRLLKDLDKERAHRLFDLIQRLSGVARARIKRHHSGPVEH